MTLDEFNKAYWDDSKSLREVAILFGIDHSTLRYRLKKLGGKTRTKGQAQSLAISKGKRQFSGKHNPNYRDGLSVDGGIGKRWSKYGLTEDSFNKILQDQDNQCAICYVDFKDTPHIDHCHKTNKVRGLLCQNCNRGIGMFDDSKYRLRNAIKYLENRGGDYEDFK